MNDAAAGLRFSRTYIRMVLNDSVAGVVRATISCRNSTKLLQLIAFGLIEFHLWVKLGDSCNHAST